MAAMPTCTKLTCLALLLAACGGDGASSDGYQHETKAVLGGKAAPQTPSHSPRSGPVTERAAVRFLSQASFGPTTESIERVMRIGMSAYIDEQFSLSRSRYAFPKDGDHGMTVLQERFFHNAINGPDQLRQRMAFALGQIFVVSRHGVFDRNAMMSYQTMLLESAFSNYFEVLKNVTLHPAMGVYLNMVHNAASDSPNENYAREMLQLFSIGTALLNPDGSEKVDRDGTAIASYEQAEVEGIARALTGWTFPTEPGSQPKTHNPWYFFGPMIPSESLHDRRQKTILNGIRLPSNQSAEEDLNDVLSAVFSHPNVGPFISYRLIQRFVTSNPSPEYVRRVARVFDANERGVRGDLKAVIKAVLLDQEARRGDDSGFLERTDGRLKEPVLFITGLLRALEAKSAGVKLNEYSTQMGHDLFGAPSVFGYYPFDHVTPQTGIRGPEFKSRTGPSIVALANFVNSLVYGLVPEKMTIDLGPWVAIAAQTDRLIDTLDLRLMHGSMSESMRATLIDAIDSHPPEFLAMRAQTALYLVATSPQYAVQR